MGWLDDRKKVDELTKQNQDWETKSKASEDKQKELEQKLSDLEAQRVTERSAVEQMNTEFERIKTSLAEAERNKQKPPEEPTDFDEDPEKAFNQRINPLAQATVLNAAQTARILAQQQLDNQDSTNGTSMDGRLFRAWNAEITAESSKYPAQALMKPENWLGIFFYIKGMRSDELSNPEVRKKKYAFLESGRSGSPPPPEKVNEGDKLTDEELHICDRMGVKPENYLKRKKELKFVGV